MKSDIQTNMGHFLKSQNGVYRDGQGIPRMIKEIGATNTVSERQLSKVTYINNLLINANIETVSGLSSMQLNRYLEETNVPLTPKQEERRSEAMKNNFAIGLGDKLNDEFLLVCVKVALEVISDEKDIIDERHQSQIKRSTDTTETGRKKIVSRISKQAL